MKKETKKKTVEVLESVTVTLEKKELDALECIFCIVMRTFPYITLPMKAKALLGLDVIGDILDKTENPEKPKSGKNCATTTKKVYEVTLFEPNLREAMHVVEILNTYFTSLVIPDKRKQATTIVQNNGCIVITDNQETARALYKCLQSYGFKVCLNIRNKEGGQK